jgi:hypothetical protein
MEAAKKLGAKSPTFATGGQTSVGTPGSPKLAYRECPGSGAGACSDKGTGSGHGGCKYLVGDLASTRNLLIDTTPKRKPFATHTGG